MEAKKIYVTLKKVEEVVEEGRERGDGLSLEREGLSLEREGLNWEMFERKCSNERWFELEKCLN